MTKVLFFVINEYFFCHRCTDDFIFNKKLFLFVCKYCINTIKVPNHLSIFIFSTQRVVPA